MEKISRKEFLEYLEGNWESYTKLFRMLAEEEQEAFLKEQGYARFGDLLAHIIAWWQDGAQFIKAARKNPSLPLPEIDVDTFNAQAVAKFAQLRDVDLIYAFETQRQAMVKLVNGLSDAQLDSENINKRLYFEIISHWEEHQLNG